MLQPMRSRKVGHLPDSQQAAAGQQADRPLFCSLISLETVMDILIRRLNVALTSLPEREAWLYSSLLLLAYVLIALPIGFHYGFLRFEVVSSWKTVMRVISISFFFPGIFEEVLFRVLLIPHPTEGVAPTNLWFWAGLSWLLFVASHPLNVFAQHETFKNPVFLVLAALLGLVCTLAYLQSGSLWTPVILHWLIVDFWLLVFEGYSKVRSSEFGEGGNGD